MGPLRNVVGLSAKIRSNLDILTVEKQWVLEEENQGGLPHLMNNYKICQGEDLTIPYLGKYLNSISNNN
jgi:hypothetical protein